MNTTTLSTNWVRDVHDMHCKYGVHTAIKDFDVEKLRQFLAFRLSFLEEELNETRAAASPEAFDAEEVVDGLIDLCVVAIGTLDAFGVNSYLAWKQVHDANMSKRIGVKASRPNPLGLPDLVKPENWQAPSHANNHGKFADML